MVDSPCKQLCSLDPDTRTCVGCGRRAHEIAGWLRLSEDEQRAVIADLPRRHDELRVLRIARNAARRGGRSRRLRAPVANNAD